MGIRVTGKRVQYRGSKRTAFVYPDDAQM